MVGNETAATKNSRLVGTTFSYDITRFPFAALFLNRLNQHPATKSAGLESLENLHRSFNSKTIGSVYDVLYAFEEEAEFRDLYGQYIDSCVRPLFGDAIRFQRKPGIRVHLPETMTVQYHTDEWYGHGRDVLNFWSPLTRAFESNSLHVADLQTSIAETGRLEAAKASLPEINAALARVAKPLALDYGQTFIFSARSIHGTENNATGLTRFSMDYRAVAVGGDTGVKNVDDYYLTTGSEQDTDRSSREQSLRACSYLFPKHGFTRFVDSNHQRSVVQEFARSRGLTIIAEETEIRTMSHHPSLLQLAKGVGTHQFDSVVLFSVLCLPPDRTDRARLFETARANNIRLFFALERLAFPSEADEAALELIWAREFGQ